MHGRLGRGEAKLVRCAHGAVHDVLVDIRPGSATFGRQQAFLLDDEAFRHLYVPPGFLHGFQALSDTARRLLPHRPSARSDEDIGVRWDDAHLGIDWPQPPTIVSPRDAAAGDWAALLEVIGG